MLLNPGTVLSGRYEILDKIGSGGMAVVYRGKDRKLDRYVTLKVLREEFAGDEEFIERFRGLTDALLDHPKMMGLCYTQLTDVEQEQNGIYDYYRNAKFPPEIFREIMTQSFPLCRFAKAAGFENAEAYNKDLKGRIALLREMQEKDPKKKDEK